MNIWTCKTAVCVFLSFGVSACGTLPIPDLGFASALSTKNTEGEVYTTAKMLNGRVTLTPPPEYCINGDSLTQTFALMARCKVLASDPSQIVDETDIVTASFTVSDSDTAPTVAALTEALAPLDVRNGYVEDAVVYAEVTDPDVQPALDPVHWRGILSHKGTVVGFASYAPKGLSASPHLIEQTARLIRDNNTTPVDSPKATGALKSNLMSIVGLFQ